MKADEARIKENLRQLDSYLLQALDAENRQLHEELQTTLAAGGKRLRPTLVFLCARLCDPHIAMDTLLPLAGAVEMTHTASLIHDDVIDNSGLRRGRPSLHARMGKQRAVLCGDYLLAKALLMLEQFRDPVNLALLARAASEMCLGEFQQLDSAFSLEQQTMAQYFKRIRRKTAGLIVTCCQLGARAGQADAVTEQALCRYGEYMGLAFQLSDDILDFAADAANGKPRGQDLRQGVFTPPLFYALRHSGQAKQLAALAQKQDKSETELEFLLQEVEHSGGLADTRRITLGFCQKAAQTLAAFPASEEKDALLSICENLPYRKH